ncbi:TadE/TadG family type IV pilus assembly protein [Mesorhizobium erdmanii]|uniref:TadE/TadG family type IV pilus assembly protein n=1 Tax=Mesorhizobium erdmanii TaxID=1777866 RepID=UPI00041595EF|nr:TadE/TadG family type IV pilus assembly protein [Mesorhizobium erdmanii]
MIRKFGNDRRGNYALMTVLATVPLIGGLALGIDFTEMSRQRQNALNALDAAGIATAQQIVAGASDADAKAYAKNFFETNLAHIDPANTTLAVTLPNNNTGGGTLKLCGTLTYKPYFAPTARILLGGTGGDANVAFNTCSEVRLKNTLEVSLVLDNSGSMTELGKGSNKVRFDLLKSAAKQLVDQLAGQAQMMRQVTRPVQFSLVPFAASVNVGPDNASAAWMDTTGISPIHHENFGWLASMSPSASPWGSNKYAENLAGVWYAKGAGWSAAQKDRPLTRFSLFDLMQTQIGSHQAPTGTQTCTTRSGRTTCVPDTVTVPDYGRTAAWGGCVEARPSPHNISDTAASTGTPATMFVPMFAPDEPGNKWTLSNGSVKTFNVINSWWDDNNTSTNTSQISQLARQTNMAKYLYPAPMGFAIPDPIDGGPNYSCTTTPITALTDVTISSGLNKIKTAIDNMQAVGATNVPEGLAWGWRTLSSGAPFTEGRPETERGNDKVVIVLTDGANTYYTPGYFRRNDYANNRSSYSAFGYTGVGYSGTSTTRMYMNTSSNIGKSTYTEENYSNAMNEQFTALCDNAKAGNIIVMTIALDLDSKNTAEKAQMDALKACSSDSRFRKDQTDPSKPEKLFWNSTGATLSDDFKAIGNELSNLRIVS